MTTVTPRKTGLREQIERVALMRNEAAEAKHRVAEARAIWEEANANLLAEEKGSRDDLEKEEAALRAMALAEFRETGEKKPGPGLSVSIGTRLHYEPAEALAWAKRMEIALALDTKAFEAVAKTTPLPFVTVEDEPKVSVARDLGAALGGAA